MVYIRLSQYDMIINPYFIVDLLIDTKVSNISITWDEAVTNCCNMGTNTASA